MKILLSLGLFLAIGFFFVWVARRRGRMAQARDDFFILRPKLKFSIQNLESMLQREGAKPEWKNTVEKIKRTYEPWDALDENSPANWVSTKESVQNLIDLSRSYWREIDEYLRKVDVARGEAPRLYKDLLLQVYVLEQRLAGGCTNEKMRKLFGEAHEEFSRIYPELQSGKVQNWPETYGTLLRVSRLLMEAEEAQFQFAE